MTDSETVIEEIKASKKYRVLCEDTIRDVVSREAGKHKSARIALKSIKKKLHLILADYLGKLNHAAAADELQAAFASGDENKIRETCLDIMGKHASTRERLDILPEFYEKIFAVTGRPKTLADLACALNPLSFRWMGLAKSTRYQAYDNNTKTVHLLAHYFGLEGLEPAPGLRDILCQPPADLFDVGLLLKMYHCLEHRRKGAGWQVVERAPVKWLAVSFPTRSLANRRVGIFANYKGDMTAKIEKRGWHFQVLNFRSEAVLLLDKT